MSLPEWRPDNDAPVAAEILDAEHGRVSLTVLGDDAVLSVSILFHDPRLARSFGEQIYGLMLEIDADRARRRMT